MGTLRIHPLNNFAMYHRAVMFLLFSSSVMSNSLRPHGLQHARLPYSLLSPRDCPHSCPLSQWCQTSILSSVIPFSTCPKSSPASGSFPVSWLFSSGGQSIGTSASASVLPMNIQDWFPLEFTAFTSCCSRDYQEISSTTIWNHQFFCAQSSLCSKSHIHHDCWKNHTFDSTDLCW